MWENSPHMSTIHNPTQFDPADYLFLDYFDNKRPQYHFGVPIEAHLAMIKTWELERDRLFTDGKCHKCVHCGNGNVRWVVSALHNPTQQKVCFGADCAIKLNFQNRNDLKLAILKAQAATDSKSLKLYATYQRFIAANPKIAEAEKQIDDPVHAKNGFARDVLGKLRQYGSLSDRQVSAVLGSLAKDIEFAARRAAVKANEVVPTTPAPEGRITVSGKILAIKTQYSAFGAVEKMLIVLADGNKVYVSKPNGSSVQREETVSIMATFERSKTDEHFSFGSRPRLMSAVAKV
jgi:hypothetical protein